MKKCQVILLIPKLHIKILCGLLCSFSFCHSQEDDQTDISQALEMTLDELLNTKIHVSSTSPIDLFSTPSTVTVVDRDVIERFDFETVAEALAIVPGIDVLQTIIDRNVTTSRGILQNFYANKILLMINNIPTWQPIYGNGYLERIDIHDVERIEVLKSPASVLYGSNAYSGVVNIILRNKQKSGVNAYARVGYPLLGSVGVNSKLGAGRKSLFLSMNNASEERTPYNLTSARGDLYQGDSIYSYQEKYINRNFTVIGRYKDHELFFNGFYFGHSFMGANPSYVSGGGQIVNNQGFLANYRYQKQFSTKLNFVGNASYDFFHRDFPLSQDKSNLIWLSGSRSSLDTKINYKLSKTFDLEVGGLIENRVSYGHDTRNGIRDTLIRHNLLNDDNVLEWSFFGQFGFHLSKFHFLAGWRYTYNKHFGENISPRLTALLEINKSNSVKLIYGHAFRVPTMFELYFNHPTVSGNPDLTPELCRSLEVSYLFKYRNLYAQLLGFYGHYENMILRSENSIYENSVHFSGYGFEAEFIYRQPGFGYLFVNYNYLKGFNDGDEINYKYVPDHSFSYGISKSLKRFYITLSGRVISETQGNLEIIPIQYFVDFGAGFTHTINNLRMYHSLSIKNITQCKYLIPEYIRNTENINSIPTMAYGTRFVYTIRIKI